MAQYAQPSAGFFYPQTELPGSAAGPVLVAELIDRQAQVTPELPALCAGSEALSYRHLDTRANKLAHALRQLGIGRGSVIALALDRSPDFVIAALGVWRAGGVYLPIDREHPADRVDFMLSDAKAEALIVSGAKVKYRAGARVLDIKQLLSHVSKQLNDGAPSQPTANDVAYLIYTSGSTGLPKGVQVTHRGLLNLVQWHNRAFLVTSTDRATQFVSLGFDAAVWEIWPYLSVGASIHFVDEQVRLHPELLRDWLLREQITISFVPTPMAERLIALPWPKSGALRTLLTGADILHRYPPAHLPFALINNYGPTECTVVASSGRVPCDDRAGTRPSIGRPIDNTSAYVCDENLNPVPPGTAGELYIGGLGLARGYVNRADLEAERFIPNRFSSTPGERLYRTGDLVRMLPDGEIEFIGRLDDQIKIRGYRIEPAEIVGALDQCPGVQASAIGVSDDDHSDKRLTAYVVPQPGASLTDAFLREFLRSRLPAYMLPYAFVALDELPVNASGKVDRSALPPPSQTNVLGKDAFASPCTSVESKVAEILSSLLRIEKVGANDNFFLLGGHSLLGTQLIAQIRETFGVEIRLLALFENPSVSALSSKIESELGHGSALNGSQSL
jgi:amino acid adenylation domain-containing protein